MFSQWKNMVWGVALLFAYCTSDDYAFRTEYDVNLDNAIEQSVGKKTTLMLPSENDLDAIPADPKNPLTPEKVKLGKFLFHETGLGQNPKREEGRGTYSCASCHFAGAGFQAKRFQGIGEGGEGHGLGYDRDKKVSYKANELDVQAARTPAALNAAFQINMLWNGQFGGTGLNVGTEAQWKEKTPKEINHLGFEGIETQAIAGLDVHRLVVNDSLITQLGYLELFDAAFGNIPTSERYNTIQAGLAIAAYERTILATQAPFQQWLKGDIYALTREEKAGAILFFGKAGCVNCHAGPSLANMEFHGIGFNDLYACPDPVFMANNKSIENKGRGGFTGNPEDDYKFKVPQLYNLKDSPFYGHGSSFKTVEEVIQYKNRAAKQNNKVPDSQLSPFFKPLGLTQLEIKNLTSFVENSLYDPNLQRYEPESLPSNNCFPNADTKAREMIGCE